MKLSETPGTSCLSNFHCICGRQKYSQSEYTEDAAASQELPVKDG